MTVAAAPGTTSYTYWLNSTPYGQQLAALLARCSAGGFYVGGLPERAAFRSVLQAQHLPSAREGAMKIVGTLKNLEIMRQAIKDLASKKVEVGFFETSKYDDAAGTPLPMSRPFQEFGYPEGGIPARPFMRPTQNR